MTKSLTFSIWVPVIVSLVVPMVFLEGVIQVTVNPTQLGNVTKVKWHLCVFSWLVVVQLSEGIYLFVEIRMDDLITQVVVGSALVPEVLWGGSRVEIKCCHI